MECPLASGRGAELTVGYVARTLDPETEAAYRLHATICADCREAIAAQQAVWSALDAWPELTVSPDFDERLYRRIAQEHGWTALARLRWSWRPALPVTAACIALAAALVWKYPAQKPVPPLHDSSSPGIEQVEHALDDMDLLKPLGVEAPAGKRSSSQKI